MFRKSAGREVRRCLRGIGEVVGRTGAAGAIGAGDCEAGGGSDSRCINSAELHRIPAVKPVPVIV